MNKLEILMKLEFVARLLRALGLHPITRLGRRLLQSLIGDIAISLDVLVLAGSVHHRGYLWSLREQKREAYMSTIFREVVKPGMVVCDIGSYIGYYALLAGIRVGDLGRVFAFEPDPHSFAYLRRNIELNRLQGTVLPFKIAVTDQSGFASFYLHEGDRSRSSIFWQDDEVRRIMVECTSLDEFLYRREVKSVDVIEMDIEGGELHALRGMQRTLSQSPKVVMFLECNPKALRAAGGSADELLYVIRQLGFTVSVIDEQNRRLVPVNFDIESVKYVNL